MSISFSVSTITLTDGTVISPPANGMTVFIGPNNSGKSLLLRELSPRITAPTDSDWKWVSEVQSSGAGSGHEFLGWAAERGHRTWVPDAQGAGPTLRGGQQADYQVPVASAVQWWEHGLYQSLRSMLVTEQWANERLNVMAQTSRWDQAMPAFNPVQYLYEDPDLLKELSRYTLEAFGKALAVDWTSTELMLRVGSTDMPDCAPPSSELVRAYRRLPQLTEQGDGFKAFVQILLHTVLRPAPVILIDEPEAFLHPPQARLLGRKLAQMPGQTQVFVATHSADFLAGVLDAQDARPLALVRLDRSSGSPRARDLDPDAVAELLRAPLLRYSNISSGLFYDRVVLCEAEGDCQFYAATFDTTRDHSAPHENTIFLHTNGKARLADTARRLRAFGIPTAAIADFDLLNDHGTVRNAMGALGGTVRDMSGDIKTLNDYANAERSIPTVAGFRKQVESLLIGRGDRPLTEAMISNVSDLLKGSSGWGALKKSGLNALNGDVYAAAERLLKHTAAHGLFLVPCGELEQWVRSVPSGNKARWLADVFNGPERWYQKPTTELQDFCQQIRCYLDLPHQP
ncbi:AAA family ATPase [Streptomyces sp. NPDC052101]|uniref:ATP-dependent nuclease n=1 Tax=Streptomyces sp. NPDC052101 TaxID=3155763 RepID=UPI003449C452